MSDRSVGQLTSRSILHVLAPEPMGGLERVVQALAVGQATRGHSVAVAAILSERADPGGGPPGAAPAHPFINGLAGTPVAVVPVVSGRFRFWQERAAIDALCKERGVDLVHTHGRRPDVIDAGVVRRRGVPVVSTVHGFTFTGAGWRNQAYDALQRRAHRHFDAVIGVSDQVGTELMRRGVAAGRVHVIPNAYDAAETPLLSRAEARQALGLPEDATVVGWVGRLSREKGMDVLLAALAGLDRHSPVVAVLGDGRERATLETTAAALGVASRIRWMGDVPQAARLYRAFDLFVLSSRTEGTPIALFEAMAAGVPVVATAVGGVPAVVTNAEALLVAPENPAALARAIAATIADPAGSGVRAAAATRRLASRYAIGPWLDRHDALYAALATPRRIARP